jgi:hypothetical protein
MDIQLVSITPSLASAPTTCPKTSWMHTDKKKKLKKREKMKNKDPNEPHTTEASNHHRR